jgi:hypothetical protein
MAYVVDLISYVQSWVCTDETADDGTPDVVITDCMTNGVLTTSCDELKEGTINLKVTVGVAPSLVNSLSIRIYCEEAMTPGNNSIYPYTDANSVSPTNAVSEAYDSEGWVEHVLSGALLAELYDDSGSFSLRLAADGGAKSKVSEVEIDMDWDGPEINGISRDKDGVVLGSCECFLLKVTSGTVWEVADQVTSHSSTGVYQFIVPSEVQDFVIAFYKADSPDVMDITEIVNGVLP